MQLAGYVAMPVGDCHVWHDQLLHVFDSRKQRHIKTTSTFEIASTKYEAFIVALNRFLWMLIWLNFVALAELYRIGPRGAHLVNF